MIARSVLVPGGAMPALRIFSLCLTTTCAALAHAAAPLFVEASVAPNPVEVGAQAVYTLRFFQAVDFQQVQIRPPQARLAEMRALEAVAPGERVIDGRRYRVSETRYAVLPFASGVLAVTDAAISGRSVDGRIVTLPAGELTLQVEPAPPPAAWPAGAAWLPARRVELHADAAAPGILKRGDALTRTLRLEAEGVDAAALPELSVGGPGWRVHADAPEFENRETGTSVIGLRSQRFHWVATEVGALTLPAVGIDWWNVTSRRWERAQLPANQVTVTATTPSEEAGKPPAAAIGVGESLIPVEQPSQHVVLIGAVSLATLLALLVMLGSRTRPAWRRWQARRKVLVACRRHDASAARDALLVLGTMAAPDKQVLTTGDVARCFPGAAAAIAQLEAALYGRQSGLWRGDRLAAWLDRI